MGDEEEREPIEIEVGLRRFRLVCKAWPWKVSRRWVVRLTKRALAAVAQSGADDVDGAAILDGFDEATLEQFLDDCEAHTDVVEVSDVTAPAAMPFTKFAPLLRARPDVALRLAREHAEIQLTPFFASLPSVLGGLTAPAEGAAGKPASSG